LTPDTTIVPVPLHWSRMIKRRYNQADLLARQLARRTQTTYCPDGLRRIRATRKLDGHKRFARFEALEGAIAPHPSRMQLLRGRDVLIVDDVMTSGATFAACAEALLSAGAREVRVLALARVVKDT